MNVEKRPEAGTVADQTPRPHWLFTACSTSVILIFRQVNSKEVITAVFDIAGYTYGPLLGLYAFGMFNKRPVIDRAVPFICLASPVFTYIVNENSAAWFGGYQFGF